MSDRVPRWTVDANIILRYLLADIPELTSKARSVLMAVAEGRIVAVCDAVTLAEVVFVLSSVYKLPNAQISEGLIPLLQMDNLELAAKDRYIRALRLFAGEVRHFGDACACATAIEKCEGKLVSFDRKLSSVASVTRAEEVP
jgi:predicted nucleic acid-binding protein